MSRPLAGKKARELMERTFFTMEGDVTVADAVRLLDERNKGGCLVKNAIGDTIGIFTERDVLRRVVAKGRDPVRTRIDEVMTTDVVFAQAEDDAWELLCLMVQENFRHLPVVDGRQAVGIISLKGLCRALTTAA